MHHVNIGEPDKFIKVLLKVFPEEAAVKSILEGAKSSEVKQKLILTTDHAVELGAFGAPWFSVARTDGKVEQFFGSDRWVYSTPSGQDLEPCKWGGLTMGITNAMGAD